MYKRTLLAGIALPILSLFLFAAKSLAGGQLVSLDADSYGSTNSDGTYGRIMRVVSQAFPCEGTEVTFKFVDPKDGDYVMTSSGNATFVFTKDRQPYYQDGESVCGTTAKMGSKVLGERNVTVTVKNGNSVWADPPVIKVDFDGQYHSDNFYNGYSYSSSQDHLSYRLTHPQTTPNPTPYPAPTGTLTVNVLSQQIIQPNNRTVLLKWSALEGGSIFYDIYGKSTKDAGWQRLLSDQGGPSATVTIKANEDYSIKVQGCIRKVGNCVNSNELLLTKIHKQEGKVVIPQVTSIAANTDNQQVEELNKKVGELEGKLAESQKRQNALELAFNNLVSWLKTHIPFFK